MLLKKIYNLIPFKKQLFVVLKFLFKPSKSIYQHLHFKGIFNVKISGNESFIIKHYGYELENELFWKGIYNGWEKESMKWWIKLCRNSHTIFDVGANTGLFSLAAKAVNNSAEIHAFEPIPMVFNKLVTNCELNQFNIKCNQLALSNKSGEATIYLPNNNHAYSVTVNKNMNQPNVKVIEQQINIITLAEYIQSNHIYKIDLMKIDVETHEYEVLEGMKEFLEKMQPTMLIEILNDEIGKKVQTLFDKCNYIYFDVNENGKTTFISNIHTSSSFNYLVCSIEVAKKLSLMN